jgi:transcriptional regulator GlxA family with amidase domain
VSLACAKLGRPIPGDLGILSLFDERSCLFGYPAISGVRADGRKLGYAAMAMLDRMFKGGKVPVRPREIAPRRIVDRGSTALAPGKGLSPQIVKAVAFIKENACEGITVKEVLAATQSASRRKFYDDFIAQVGHAPAEQIRREKIARAAELLRDSSLSVRRISELCGFTNVTRFQVHFRRIVGQTPAQFRAAHR